MVTVIALLRAPLQALGALVDVFWTMRAQQKQPRCACETPVQLIRHPDPEWQWCSEHYAFLNLCRGLHGSQSAAAMFPQHEKM